jgi:hypothetical protein
MRYNTGNAATGPKIHDHWALTDLEPTANICGFGLHVYDIIFINSRKDAHFCRLASSQNTYTIYIYIYIYMRFLYLFYIEESPLHENFKTMSQDLTPSLDLQS